MSQQIVERQDVPANSERWPTEIRLSGDKRTLNVAFEDGGRFALPAEYLRVSSPSAEVQGHSPSERKVIGGKIDVAILAVEPVGNYAVKLTFDDMHDTGLFGWAYLYDLGREYRKRWPTYLAELEERGLSREPAKRSAAKPVAAKPDGEGSCGSGCGCH
ncbi:gamma-butyrobetaine hydroxylase-like domain-containing protein [uncultured Methylobacterium sp.]|uniref:gamma-butyrobetaine hydroxylase-like domain-containing protein n=1 Tax=uncultured Methylobacterium sp. TaxID=157278 RepID=UPI0035CA47F6